MYGNYWLENPYERPSTAHLNFAKLKAIVMYSRKKRRQKKGVQNTIMRRPAIVHK
jgi:hypothetical protein